ncbi:hypothetical protein AC1031_017150 [Aphanomyces cochlioides]|nr:hypothetical protein AC1031_017150 [Aphanomyces cochlioides]
MSSVITAVAIPSLYALYVWYAHRTLDIPRQRQRRRVDVPVALVASSTVKLRSNSRMSIKSVFAVDQPSPPVSNVLYTSRGDVAVNLNKDELSTDALAYLMEVTDSGDDALLDDENDDVTITRTDFDDMIKFAAEHFKELPFAYVQTMSIEPRTSIASLLAQHPHQAHPPRRLQSCEK